MANEKGRLRLRPVIRSAWETDVTQIIPLHFRKVSGTGDKEEEDMECVDLCEWLPNRVPCGGGKIGEMPSYLFQPLGKKIEKTCEKQSPKFHEVSIDLEDIPCLEDTEEEELEIALQVPTIDIPGRGQEQRLQHFMTLQSTRKPGSKVWERWQVFEVFGNHPHLPYRMTQDWVSGSNWKSVLEQMKQSEAPPAQQLSTYPAINKQMLTSWRAQQHWNSIKPSGRRPLMGHEYEMAVIGAYNYHGSWRALDNIKML